MMLGMWIDVNKMGDMNHTCDTCPLNSDARCISWVPSRQIYLKGSASRLPKGLRFQICKMLVKWCKMVTVLLCTMYCSCCSSRVRQLWGCSRHLFAVASFKEHPSPWSRQERLMLPNDVTYVVFVEVALNCVDFRQKGFGIFFWRLEVCNRLPAMINGQQPTAYL